MRPVAVAVIACCASVLSVVVVLGQTLTIPELVRRDSPNPILRVRQRELVPETFEQALRKAEVIVQGAVERIDVYLSKDQMNLYSDYTITPSHMIRQSTAILGSQPGQPTSLVVKRWGGETTIAGVKVSVQEMELRNFTLGEQLVLMLKYDQVEEKHVLAADFTGAFAVEGDHIMPLLKHPIVKPLEGLTVAQLDAAVHRLGW